MRIKTFFVHKSSRSNFQVSEMKGAFEKNKFRSKVSFCLASNPIQILTVTFQNNPT